MDDNENPQKKYLNNHIEKLLNLSSKTDLKIFKKEKNDWVLRDKRIIINKCQKMKQYKIKNLSDNLKNISSTNENSELNKIKKINNKTLNDIEDINNIIEIVNNNCEDEYIAIYSN